MSTSFDVGEARLVPGSQDRGQRAASPCDARAHGAARHATERGDLGVVEAVEISEHDGHPELDGQRRQRSVDVDAVDRALGSVRVRGSSRTGEPIVDEIVDVGGDGPSSASAQVVDRPLTGPRR